MNFTERLRQTQQSRQSHLCIGLDVDPAKLPDHLKGKPDGLTLFTKAIIRATSDLVCAYKPNLAFYEALGDKGGKVLRSTLKAIPQGVLTIGDGKRGDVGNTSTQYAKALFDDLGFDAVTVNPYMGFDSVEPFLQDESRGVFLLALTSNPGSNDFQRQKIGNVPLYEIVVRTVSTWNVHHNVGIVVGATHPDELRQIRSIAPAVPMLIPGIGTQGGDLDASVTFGATLDGVGAVINASRSILYASSGKDFAEAARAEAIRLRDTINQHHPASPLWRKT